LKRTLTNSLRRGQTLSIEAVGTLLEDVEEGAKVILQVKYGLIRLVNTEADLCEQVSNVDLSCPIKKGKTTIKKDVELPKEIPPVRYSPLGDYLDFADFVNREPIQFSPMPILLTRRRSCAWKLLLHSHR
jgi:hypothetical protein